MGEVVEDGSAPRHQAQAIQAPPMQMQYNSPSLSRNPLLLSVQSDGDAANRTQKSSHQAPNFLSPLGTPLRKAIQLTKLDPQDAWLPITESRNGNAYYAAFHTLCSGIGIQALVLPVAFTILGWYAFSSCTLIRVFVCIQQQSFEIDSFNFK